MEYISTIHIEKGSKDSYKGTGFVEEYHVMSPMTCDFINFIGKEVNGDFYVYNSKNKHLFTIVKKPNGYVLNIIPRSGKIFGYCGVNDRPQGKVVDLKTNQVEKDVLKQINGTKLEKRQ